MWKWRLFRRLFDGVQIPQHFTARLRKKYGDDAGLRKAWGMDGKSALAEGEGLGAGQRIDLLTSG